MAAGIEARTAPLGKVRLDPFAVSTAGMLLSLSNALPAPDGALGRSARHLAHRLAQGTCSRADLDAASDMLALLLVVVMPSSLSFSVLV